jgi:hypothetical protein
VQTTEAIFTDKIRRNAWRGVSSLSGSGSDLEHTKEIIEQLPRLFRDLRIASILDIPCGDCHWMRRVDLGGIRYIGADVVTSLVDANRKKWKAPAVEFRRLDLLMDDLPTVDLVFCRDCLVHFSLVDVHRALDNICRSMFGLLADDHVHGPHNEHRHPDGPMARAQSGSCTVQLFHRPCGSSTNSAGKGWRACGQIAWLVADR